MVAVFLPTASEGWGKVMFQSVHTGGGGGYLGQVQMGGGVPQGTTSLAKVGIPPTGQDRGRGYRKVPTTLAKVGTPPPARSGWGRQYPSPSQVRTGGCPKVPTPGQGRYPSLPRARSGQEGTPRYLPPRYPSP